jgi:hypothetical protein
MLPNTNWRPAELLQLCIDGAVPLTIALDFALPERMISFGH